MTGPESGSLSVDCELMRTVASKIDTRNDDIRAMLQAFIARMTSVPPSVWGGTAATAFSAVVDRWNAESLRLNQALTNISDTIRLNERQLSDAGQVHARQIGAIAGQL